MCARVHWRRGQENRAPYAYHAQGDPHGEAGRHPVLLSEVEAFCFFFVLLCLFVEKGATERTERWETEANTQTGDRTSR